MKGFYLAVIWCGFAVCSPILQLMAAENKDYISHSSTATGIDYSYIRFDDLAPEGYQLNQSWNGLGMDDAGRVYIGWTSLRPDGLEDFVVFQYDPATQQRKLIGTMMTASAAANNLAAGEAIPKGHTEMIHVDGKMYMASQGFHDFKWEIDDLPKYRGAHLYQYDISTERFTDISASMPGGVVLAHEGIVALSYLKRRHQLVGLSHPHSNMVFIDLNPKVQPTVVAGIPWVFGNPLSREVIIDKYGKIYLYRGTEMPNRRNENFKMWVYDTNNGEMRETEQRFRYGFWSGQAHTQDGNTIYISTVNGGLFALDTASATVRDLGPLIPVAKIAAEEESRYLYDITLSQDERYLYALPPAEFGDLYRYDIEQGEVTQIAELPDDIYTSNNLQSADGDLYFAKFKAWSGEARLMILHGLGAD